MSLTTENLSELFHIFFAFFLMGIRRRLQCVLDNGESIGTVFLWVFWVFFPNGNQETISVFDTENLSEFFHSFFSFSLMGIRRRLQCVFDNGESIGTFSFFVVAFSLMGIRRRLQCILDNGESIGTFS